MRSSPLPHKRAGALALLRMLQRPLKDEMTLSAFAVLCFMAAHPGSHARRDLMLAIHRNVSTRNMEHIIGALVRRGLITSRLIPGKGKNGRQYRHSITAAGMDFVGVSKPPRSRS